MGSLPHACGGVSPGYQGIKEIVASSPRLWGCFSRPPWPPMPTCVFPTPVGVFLSWICVKRFKTSLPHACGGVSRTEKVKIILTWSSPRLWGCFRWMDTPVVTIEVFPTPVGVFLLAVHYWLQSKCLPHACGGVSEIRPSSPAPGWSSPRLWGCFSDLTFDLTAAPVFPTPVGVFPTVATKSLPGLRLPHACGGVSPAYRGQEVHLWSSPRLWGCFRIHCCGVCRCRVFPTPVGVFLIADLGGLGQGGLPHACGGVSDPCIPTLSAASSSPRLWGCFYCELAANLYSGVFPTPVGVFLEGHIDRLRRKGLPHACGGVSCCAAASPPPTRSSPRLWGCFPSSPS